jgi:undecaprenyl-diphosphatase
MLRPLLRGIVAWDDSAAVKIYGFKRNRGTGLFMSLLALLGDGLIYPFYALVIGLSDLTVFKKMWPAVLVALTIEKTLSLGLKNTIKRPRPYQKFPAIKYSAKPQDKYSFPSGHSGVTIMTAILFCAYFPPLAVPAFVFVVLNGYARVYHGVHYPGDVIIGMILGTVGAIISLCIFF